MEGIPPPPTPLPSVRYAPVSPAGAPPYWRMGDYPGCEQGLRFDLRPVVAPASVKQMSLHSTLATILTEYPKVTSTQQFGGNSLAGFIRDQAADDVQNALGDLGVGLVIEGSAGAGNWALVPWISVFDPAITTSATKGYHVVYLFHVNQPTVYLSLNQGTTSVREEFGSRAREILRDRSDLMRKRIADYTEALPAASIELGSNARLPGDYAAGHAIGVSYDLGHFHRTAAGLQAEKLARLQRECPPHSGTC